MKKKTNEWKLWKNVIVENGPVHYVWTQDNIIRYSRVVQTFGWGKDWEAEKGFIGFNVHLEQFDFRPVKTKMTQEELSKGWLV